MKRFGILMIAFIIGIFAISCESISDKTHYTFEVKDGADNIIKFEEFDYDGRYHSLAKIMGKENLNNFVQRLVDKCKSDCKYERSFVPTDINIYWHDTIRVKITDELTAILYRYNYWVKGYAKNGFGVEGEVEKMYFAKDTIPTINDYKEYSKSTAEYLLMKELMEEPQFLVILEKNNKEFYDLLSDVDTEEFVNKLYSDDEYFVNIPFDYNGWKLCVRVWKNKTLTN